MSIPLLSLAIRNYHDSGNVGMIHSPLGTRTAFFDRLGRHEPAATIAGFAVVNPPAALNFPAITTAIANLHEVLGDAVYESLAHDGETMTSAQMAAYAYDQIDQTRAALNTDSK